MLNTSGFNAKGVVTINTYEAGTNILVDSYKDNNTVTTEGLTEIINRILTNSGTSDSIVTNIKLGDDAGNGTLLSPEDATANLTYSDQDVVYDIKKSDTDINASGGDRITASVVIEGSDVMNNEFPTDIVLNFCSATLRFESGSTFAYKRFPVRSLSRLVDISITWEIELLYA